MNKRLAKLALGLVIALTVLSCAAPQFVLGDVVPEPLGCTDARTRGHDC